MRGEIPRQEDHLKQKFFFCLFKHSSSPLEIPKSFYNIRLLIEILPNHVLGLAIKVIERFSSSTRVDKL